MGTGNGLTRITRSFRIDAGHRILGHEGLCAHLHGHSYTFEINIGAPQLDHLHRVVDFSVVKAVLGHWLNSAWDHAFLVYEKDEEVLAFLRKMKFRHWVFGGPPTAELLAQAFYHMAWIFLPSFTIYGVRCYETPNCWADYFEDPDEARQKSDKDHLAFVGRGDPLPDPTIFDNPPAPDSNGA